jgi:hypothetical protein
VQVKTFDAFYDDTDVTANMTLAAKAKKIAFCPDVPDNIVRGTSFPLKRRIKNRLGARIDHSYMAEQMTVGKVA